MDFKELPDIDKKIYAVCLSGSPANMYLILARLMEKEVNISYSYLCQRVGILTAMGFITKITNMKGKLVGYKSVEREDIPYQFFIQEKQEAIKE